MKVFAAFALLAGVVSAKAPATVTEDYTFETYVNDFRKVYSKKELAVRKEIFEANLRKVILHNKSGKSWTETVNDFSDATPEEVKLFLRSLFHTFIAVLDVVLVLPRTASLKRPFH